MNLAELSIKRPVFAWMLMIGLLVFGGIAFFRLGISQMPDVDFPVVTVCITLEGAAPEVMETQVADIVEDTVMSLKGIREVSSSSRQGRSCVTVEFELSRDIDVALQEIQTRVAQIQKRLPIAIDPPTYDKNNPEDNPIMWVALHGDRPLRDLMVYTHDYLKNQFSTISGVGEVFLGGYIDPNLRLWLNAEKMNRHEISVQDVMAAITSEHSETPAGFMDTGKQELNIRVMGEANTLKEFEQLIIPQRSGAPIWKKIRLGDIGDVEAGLDEVRRISRYVGKPSVGLGVRKQRGANAVTVARKVRAKVDELQTQLPQGLNLRISFDLSKFTEEATNELNFTLILSAILTGLVCWLFLGSMSSTINILLAIPTSIVGTFLVLYFMGFTLNTFTLLGLTLAIGIVVDDAIMVLENIGRYREQGLSRIEAARKGATEITFAAMASTVAILAIFVPVIFMSGVIGKFFYQFGIAISAAVLFSLLEALTLTPMRCSQYLDTSHSQRLTAWVDRGMKWLSHTYQRTLAIALEYRWTVIFICLVIFAISMGAARFVRKEFVPSQDQGRFLMRVQTPIGSSISFTDNVIVQAEKFLASRPDIYGYYAAVGGFGGSEVNTANLFITMKPYKERPTLPGAKHPVTQQELMQAVRQEIGKIPGVFRAVVQDLSQAGFSSQRGFPVEFSLRGPDWDQLGELSKRFMAEMQSTNLMVDIDTDYQLGMPEIQVRPNREKASEHGVSVASIATTINAMIGGVRIGNYTEGGKRYDIRLRLTEKDRQLPQDISKIWVRNNHGELVRLAQVIELNQKPTLVSITRKNRERAIRVFANIAPGKSQSDALKVVEAIGKKLLPDRYHLVFTGSTQTMQESFDSLLFALLLGIIVSYMVLASQFNSFLHPFTVLLALPFSISGAFFALLAADKSLNIFSMIGLILLMGIVKKNSILLVDFTNTRRQAGLGVKPALLEACPIRLRPIIMTSVSTIAAAIPAALGLGPGAETRIPMALVVIGGVLVSTLLTLFVVPCAYSLLSRLELTPKLR